MRTSPILTGLLAGFVLWLGGVPRPVRAESGSTHAVFDFQANRTLAHIEERGGLLLVTGQPGFVKYNHFSRPATMWKLHATEDGRKVALVQGGARFDVPLTVEQAGGPSIWISLKAPARSSVKVARSDDPHHASAPTPLQAGWQTVEVKLPAGLLHAGENALSLIFAQNGTFSRVKAAAAIEWIQIGGSAPAADFTAPALTAGEDRALCIRGGGSLSYYIQVPPDGALSFTASKGADKGKGKDDGCELSVSVAGADKATATLSPRLDGTPLSMSRPAGEIVRLGLHVRGTCPKLVLSSAQLVTAGAEARVERPQRPRNVVVWLTDDTRADRYRLWNPKSRVETPVIDAFSKEATRFSVAYVQGNESRVSHASLFTGMYPAQHKFIAHNVTLDSHFTILPEAVRTAGLYTIGHIANGYISKRWGFGDGWDYMRNHIHEGGGLRAADLVGHAGTFLQKGAGKDHPFFLYLGTIDAHVSWRAYEPWISRYDTKPYSGPFVKGCMDPQLDKIVTGQLPITPRDKERIAALYDCDISYNDKEFGELLGLLKKSGHDKDTMIVFTSDHGEEFWDHGHIGHGQSLRQELVHVPLLVYYPPLFPAGRVVEEGVEIVDVLPTLTDALQVKTPSAVQGESLIPLAQGQGQGYPRPAVSSQYELAHTMRLSRYKLWVGGFGQIKLTDAVDDPAEAHELVGQAPLPQRFVSDAMGLWMAYQNGWKKSRWGVASNNRPELAADLEK